MKNTFYPLARPYGDFLVASAIDREVVAYLISVGFNCTQVNGIHIFTTGFIDPERILDGKELVSGLQNRNGNLVCGPVLVDPWVGDFIGTGHSIKLSGGDVLLSGDLMGVSPYFYCDSMVSNRLHVIAMALERQGLFKVNVKSVSSNFWIENSFNSQICTFQTPIDGVQVVPYNSTCRVGKDGVTVEKATASYEAVTPDQYHELIKKAAVEVSDNVHAAINNNSFPSIWLGITGGRDSRAILAALVANGQVGKVRFSTVERGLDVSIATGLVQHFGGTYGGYSDIVGYKKGDQEEAIERRKSLYYQLYHDPRFPMFPAYTPLRRDAELELVGGCGEVYRHFYQKGPFMDSNLQRKFVAADFRAQEIEKKGYWSAFFGEDKFFTSTLLDTMESLPGRTLSEKLSAHYRQFRNSMHFGLVASGMGNGKTAWQPLISPSLLRASNGMPDDVRASGRILFDLTRELCPELAYFPYEFGRPQYDAVPYHRSHHYDNYPPEGPVPAPEIIANSHQNTGLLNPSVGPFDTKAYVSGKLSEYHDMLAGTELHFLTSDKIRNKWKWLEERNSHGTLSRWYTKYEWAALLTA